MRGREVRGFCFGDLVVADPDLAVGEGEAHYVVDEWFCFSSTFGDTEDMEEQFFEEAEVRCAIEIRVEGENGAGAFEAIPCEVEFLHCVYYPLVSLKSKTRAYIWEMGKYSSAYAF